MIEFGIDVNIIDNDGFTALKKACVRGYEDITEMLLDTPDIDVNYKDRDGVTALMNAVSFKYQYIVKILLQNQEININLQDNDGNTALMYAAGENNLLIFDLLISRPELDITLTDNKGRNFIDHIKYSKFSINDFLGRYELQQYLMEIGRDDIILMFDKYGVVRDDIKEEFPRLFAAKEWGLLG